MSAANGRGRRPRWRDNASPGYGRPGSPTIRCRRPTSPWSRCCATFCELNQRGGRRLSTICRVLTRTYHELILLFATLGLHNGERFLTSTLRSLLSPVFRIRNLEI